MRPELNEDIIVVNPQEVLLYAGDSPVVLNSLLKKKVRHVIFGVGRVESIIPPRYINVMFEKSTNGVRERTFLKAAFYDGKFSEVAIPISLHQVIENNKPINAEQKRLDEKEADAKQNFFILKRKYRVAWYRETSPLSPLYRVLLRLEHREEISPEDIQWMEKERLFTLLAGYFQLNYRKTKNPWSLAKASRFWRDSQRPQRSLDITDVFVTTNNKAKAAILTTRGGDFRDLMELDNAEDCGVKAIMCNPNNKYSYNLLGAVCYQKGDPELGDEYFEKAMDLGASVYDREKTVESALQEADEQVRKKVAEYLLQKDPAQYEWVKRYLK